MASAQVGQVRDYSIGYDNAVLDTVRHWNGTEPLGAVDERTVVILLGPPGSGTGTQCKRLSNALGIPAISSGEILRSNIRASTELGRKAKKAMNRGLLVSDELICQMLASRISQADCRGGFILDGIPRTVRQAEFIGHELSRMADGGVLPRIVSLEVEDSAILQRLCGRRVCPSCGATYNVVTNPPRHDGRCDGDGAVLETREDDREEICRVRLEAHRKIASALKNYYLQQYGTITEIDADCEVEQLFSELMEIVSAQA